jgi:cell wall-associated NlpC family hydrolase
MLRLRLTLLLCFLALAWVSAQPAAAGVRTRSHHDLGVQISKYARRFIGVPYSYGGASPRSGFDCSGFVAFVYNHFGVTLPHYTFGQFEQGRRVSRDSLEPGDLVFFDGGNHVGLYMGQDRFIHAPHSGARVRIEPLGQAGPFAGARRVT